MSTAQALENRGPRVARVDESNADADTRGFDVVVRVLGQTEAAGLTALFGEGDLPGDVVFLQIAPDCRRQARWLDLVGPVGHSVTVHQFLDPDDPPCRDGLCRWLVRVAAGQSWPESWQSRWLSPLALRTAIRKNGQRNRRARTDHRRMVGRVQKLLAFTGSSGN